MPGWALVASCVRGAAPPADPPLDAVLDEAYRIAPERIDVALDHFPGAALEGAATLTFRMRPGQARPRFHFRPRVPAGATPADALLRVALDGEPLDPHADLAPLDLPSGQRGFDVARTVDDADLHLLEVAWRQSGAFPTPLGEGWLHARVNDVVGDGNDLLWPTVNSPEAFAEHRLTVRIHDDRAWVALGTGDVAALPGPEPAFEVTPDRPLPSALVFFAVAPAEAVDERAFVAEGVPVRVVGDVSPDALAEAEAIARSALGALADDLGPLPAPRIDVLLTPGGGGMEYHGAVVSSLDALEHELAHQYFGCATVGRTWRDTWFDEAAVVWWRHRGDLGELPDDFTSDLVGGRSPTDLGFDERAYGAGARTLGELAERLGGDEALVDFLADLVDRRAFAPFTTDTLRDDAVRASADPRLWADFARWYHTPDGAARDPRR